MARRTLTAEKREAVGFDPDEDTDEEERNTAVRICTQGQDMKDTANVRDRISASHPIHFELSATGGEPPSLDLSVFGTPAGVSDEAISQGWNVENFAYTNVDKVTEFGRFEQRLPHSTVMFGKRVCHVYLYVEVSRLSAAFYAIFAKDGRVIKQLQNTPFDKVFQDGELTAKWRRYRNVDLDVVRLKQVARPESLFVQPRESSASRSQPSEVIISREPSASSSTQPDAMNVDTSPSNSSAIQPDVIQVSQTKQTRISSLPKRNHAKQRRTSSVRMGMDQTCVEHKTTRRSLRWSYECVGTYHEEIETSNYRYVCIADRYEPHGRSEL